MSGRYAGAFLDRDGVINKKIGYVTRCGRFHLCPGVKAACRYLQSAGYRLIIVTNQGGIALSYYSEADYHQVTEYMSAQFRAAGVCIAGIYYCPYHPNIDGHHNTWAHWRKPEPGMIRTAAAAHRLDLARSLMVGDKRSDMESARRAGIPQRYFIGTDAPDGAVAVRSLARVAALLKKQ